MKHSIFFRLAHGLLACFLVLTLAACHHSQPQQDPIERIVNGAPIMPIRLQGETTEIYLTDYVPSLVGTELDSLRWMVSDANMLVEQDLADNVLPEQIHLRRAGADLEALYICGAQEAILIPILPDLPSRQGLYVAEADTAVLTLHFAEPTFGPVHVYAFVQNHMLCPRHIRRADNGDYQVQLCHALPGRSLLRIYAVDSLYNYNDILVPLQDGRPVRETSQLNRHDDQAQVLYSLMIDRFENGNTANDWKLNSPEVLDIVDYQGGDFAGITRRINEGWFDELGITTIWISPITQNPWSAWGMYPFAQNEDGTYQNKFDPSRPYTKFSGYHGYWPIYITKLEQRFGTPDEFRAMLDAAHAHNMNVVLDYVANHMHIEAPTFQAHPDWHTDSILPDGRRNFELWDEARLTTWFDVHIPTLDLERPEVCEPMTDSALYWLENYDLDGFRHDACKHIPLNYWRLLGQKIAKRFPDRHIWMIGETYGDTRLIGSYVKTGMLPAQFDFNIYHTAIDVLSNHNGKDMRDMSRTIEESLAAYGAHHTMGNISGNHDKCRFISLAGGAVSWNENDKLAGWTRHIGVTKDDNDPANAERMERAYKAAMLLEVINLTIPGVPCIYQGDEFGQAGANDPDNRGMMRFSGLSEREQQFRAEMEQLIKFRRNSMPLLYGDYIPVSCEQNRLVFDRIYLGDRVRVTIDTRDMSYTIE